MLDILTSAQSLVIFLPGQIKVQSAAPTTSRAVDSKHFSVNKQMDSLQKRSWWWVEENKYNQKDVNVSMNVYFSHDSV